jgi:hypothetical protein
MQWEPMPEGGFTTGVPWLPLVDPETCSVAAQRRDQDSLLCLHRDLIAVRRGTLTGPVTDLRAQDGVLTYRRGDHVVALNTAPESRAAPPAGRVVRGTHLAEFASGAPAPRELDPGRGFVAEA